MNETEMKEKLEKLAKLEEKEKKAKVYNQNYYRNWKVGFDKKVNFYNKWYGKKVGNVELV